MGVHIFWRLCGGFHSGLASHSAAYRLRSIADGGRVYDDKGQFWFIIIIIVIILKNLPFFFFFFFFCYLLTSAHMRERVVVVLSVPVTL